MPKIIKNLTIENISQELSNESKFIWVYFSASWCQPCQSFSPTFNEFAEKISDESFVFGVVDMANSPTIAQTYGVRSVPSIAVFHKGKIIDLIAGETSLQTLIHKAQQYLHTQ